MAQSQSSFPDVSTARAWLLSMLVAPLVLASFVAGLVLVTRSPGLGFIIVLAAGIAWGVLMAVNGVMYRRIKRARIATRGRLSGSSSRMVMAIWPLPRTVRSALVALDLRCPDWLPGFIALAVIGSFVGVVLALLALM